MGFFDRNRRELADRGIDPARLPPGQYHTERFPVLHVGDVPSYDLDEWTLTVDGLVAAPIRLGFDDLTTLEPVHLTTDLHCVTKWSKFDTVWTGVRFSTLFELAGGLLPSATHVVQHAEHGYTANLPLDAVLRDESMLVWAYEGAPLEAEHGYPARTLVPHLYLWKSVKWVRRIEVVDGDRPGFWERNGYHNEGDPFREQRYWGD